MALPDGGTIAADQINSEFGRFWASTMSIWEARNGFYGGINGCSGKRPGAPGRNTNSGYAWSDWWGYDHSYSCANIYSYLIEQACDADTRVRRLWHTGDWIGEWWSWSSEYVYMTPAAKHDQCYAWFDTNISWGDFWCWCYKRIYSNYRGYFIDHSYFGNQQPYGEAYWNPIYTGEYFEVQNLCY
jgi:hypothetical protein